MSESSSSSSGGIGIGIAGLLGCIFVTLKLCGVIDWSWWWVTAPFWLGIAVALAILAVVALGGAALLGVVGIWALVMERKGR